MNLAVVALLFAGVASAKVFTEDVGEQKALWAKFKLTHNVKFETSDEESRRFEIFLNNLKMADELTEKDHKNGGTASFGITRFSALTQAEFRSQYLTVDISKTPEDAPLVHEAEGDVSTTPTLVDWTGIYTTPIKDQGYCGCCWAFSSAEQVESDSMRTLSANWILSPEQFCQCVTACSGCNGGNTNTALSYAKSHSIEQNQDYPYTSYYGVTGSCSYNSAKGVVKVVSYTQISGETNLANYVQSTGPVSILVDASTWSSYTGGIMSAATCGTSIDHAVQVVGVYPVAASSGGYWKVRNQWGTSWGESGYIQLAYGTNTCNITYQPLYTSVAKA